MKRDQHGLFCMFVLVVGRWSTFGACSLLWIHFWNVVAALAEMAAVQLIIENFPQLFVGCQGELSWR